LPSQRPMTNVELYRIEEAHLPTPQQGDPWMIVSNLEAQRPRILSLMSPMLDCLHIVQAKSAAHSVFNHTFASFSESALSWCSPPCPPLSLSLRGPSETILNAQVTFCLSSVARVRSRRPLPAFSLTPEIFLYPMQSLGVTNRKRELPCSVNQCQLFAGAVIAARSPGFGSCSGRTVPCHCVSVAHVSSISV